MARSRRSSAQILALAALVVVADALLKATVTRWVEPGTGRQSAWLVSDWIGLSYGENSGIAFGLLRGNSRLVLALAGVAIVALAAILPRLVGADRWSVLGAGLIAGGAIGNLVDRVRFGHVRDFVALGPWPPFNLADAALTIGVGLLFISLLTTGRAAAPSVGKQ